MATEVAVIVPWQPGDPDRERAWAFLQPMWPWPTIAATQQPGPWSKGAAVLAGVERTDAEVLVVADADVWCDGTPAAVTAVEAGAGWAIPHGQVHRLDQLATDICIGAGIPPRFVEPTGLAEKPYRGFEGGGIVVLRRPTYLHCPIDPRFIGWGQEDQAWALALRTLHGAPWRGDEPLHHLWHTPQERRSRAWGSQASRQRLRRYRAAAGHPDRIRALLNESQVPA